jgi:nuclear transport factor 2 (NTF2) superfamily protein
MLTGKAQSSLEGAGRKEETVAERTAGLDLEAFRRAAEGKNPEAMLSLYADDAEYVRVDRNSTPSSPMALRGKEEVGEYLRDVFSREMTHRIENEVVGEERAAFNWACEYPDGTKVLAAETVEVRDGKIVRQMSVQAWDE